MRKILFIGLVVTAVVLISGCYGPTTSPNATVQPTGGTPSGIVTPVTTPIETITPVMTPVETITPVMTATSVGISTVTGTPYTTGTSYATTPISTAAVTTTPMTTSVSTITGTATVSATVATVNTVDITSNGYNPAMISVPSGTTVTWTNRDSASHTVTSTTGVFDSGPLSSGQTFGWTFSTSGSYDYGDSSNSSLSGTVVVTS